MTILAQDTFTRSNQAGWNPASDTESWSTNSNAALSISSNKGVFDLVANSKTWETLGTGTAASVNVVVRMKTPAGTFAGITFRYTDDTHNYVLGNLNGTLYLHNYQTDTDVWSIVLQGFVQTDTWWYRVVASGSHIRCRAWKDGATEPSTWLINMDNTAFSSGKFGLFSWGAPGSPSTFDSLQVTDVVTFASDAPVTYTDNPYGVTIFSYYGDPLKLQLLADMKTLGMTWLRWQLSWYVIETSAGVYDWRALDDAVNKANTAGINICIPVQDPPSWRMASSPCDATTNPATYLPDPQATADFCALVAARYSGYAGYGCVQSIQIGNEEYQASGNANCSHGYQLAPAIIKSVPAIKNAGFTGIIGAASQTYRDYYDISNFTQDLYTAGAAQLVDFLDFHYYAAAGTYSPDIAPTGQTNFDTTWEGIHKICAANGDPHKAIWICEFGYPTNSNNNNPINVVTQAQQAQYLIYEFESMRVSGCVRKGMIYTMDGGTDGQSITQGTPPSMTYLPAFTAIQNYITAYPQWPVRTYSASTTSIQWSM